MELPALTRSHTLSLISLPSRAAFRHRSSSSSRSSISNRRVFSESNIACQNPHRATVAGQRDEERRKEKANHGGDECVQDEDEEYVEVIGIGSRKDAVLDFCSHSPFQSSSTLRFWNVCAKDSVNLQLLELFVGEEDINPRIVEPSEFLQLGSKAIILVATAGHGLDHLTVIDILKAARSKKGYIVAIFLKPFNFEGQRRLHEMNDLLGKIQGYMDLCIDIDTDKLLKKDSVTLDEALKTANRAVLLAINAIFILISEIHQKQIEWQNGVKDLRAPELLKILKSYREAKIGFGAGDNLKSSFLKALYDCPFIGSGIQDLNGTVICIISSSYSMDEGDIRYSLHMFRQTTEYTGELIIFRIHEPHLEPNMILTTLVVVGSTIPIPKDQSFFSRMVQHLTFLFDFLKGSCRQSGENEAKGVRQEAGFPKVMTSPASGVIENRGEVEGVVQGTDMQEELEAMSSSDYNTYDISNSNNNGGAAEQEIGSVDSSSELSTVNYQIKEGFPGFERESLPSWNIGPGDQIAMQWAKERANTAPVLENDSIFNLPVGVRPPEDLKHSPNALSSEDFPDSKAEDHVKEQTISGSSTPVLGIFSIIRSIEERESDNNSSTWLKSRASDVPKKQGILSSRAASMLESERGSPKKWNPVVEMQYRGGKYRGKCQGGLPEGKGSMHFEDGSIYEGMWSYGKRSGPGSFYFSNGDVFQGSWRDDVMHGKGWFYFQSGDRWFANFWKGKANGESRFYSKSGDVFFGHFQDGWRHGEFLCIDVNGKRYIELWKDGVLQSRKHLDSDADA